MVHVLVTSDHTYWLQKDLVFHINGKCWSLPSLILTDQKKQAGTVLGQAQLKLELEPYFTSFKICCIKLIKLVKLRKFGGATLFILQNLLRYA